MPYLFCIIVDVAVLACVGWLGWLVWQGATVWLVAVVLALVLQMIFPGTSLFTCPQCGHKEKAKVFWGQAGIAGVQKGYEGKKTEVFGE